MNISRLPQEHGVALALDGRLDSYWSGHLASELESLMRQGADNITLDFKRIAFMSSAGISVLLQYHKKLAALGGSIRIVDPIDLVKTVMDLSGLSQVLQVSVDEHSAQSMDETGTTHDTEAARFAVSVLSTEASYQCRMIGDPQPFAYAAFSEEDCRTVAFPTTSFGLGLGALGTDFEDCRERFGEFLSVAGAVVYLPSDGTNAPDYSVAGGTFVPEIKVLYGMSLEGAPRYFARFDGREEHSVISVTDLMTACLDICGSDLVGFVAIAETSGLVGCSLKRSPVGRGLSTSLFKHPDIRDWISFSSEPVFSRSQVIVTGVVARQVEPALKAMLHPLHSQPELRGHTHAVACAYRPLRKGVLDLRACIGDLFTEPALLGLLHLIDDDRKLVGQGQSGFHRGVCWFGPIAQVEA